MSSCICMAIRTQMRAKRALFACTMHAEPRSRTRGVLLVSVPSAECRSANC